MSEVILKIMRDWADGRELGEPMEQLTQEEAIYVAQTVVKQLDALQHRIDVAVSQLKDAASQFQETIDRHGRNFPNAGTSAERPGIHGDVLPQVGAAIECTGIALESAFPSDRGTTKADTGTTGPRRVARQTKAK